MSAVPGGKVVAMRGLYGARDDAPEADQVRSVPWAAMTDPHRHRSTAALADRPPVVAGGRPRGTARLVWALIAAGPLAVGIGARVLWDGAAAIPTALQDAVTLSVSVLIESFPFVVLGVLLSVLVQLWLPPWVFEKLLPKTPWLRRCISRNSAGSMRY